MKENAPQNKSRTIEALRHNEYYDMQPTLDMLYQQSKEGNIFTQLKQMILSEANILLAYRNIKQNTGSTTAGIDGLTIKDIAKLSQEEVVQKVNAIVEGKNNDYNPKPVRRKEIPKPNGGIRPLGIPCIWDRLIQQCVYQILEPICEAKFSKHSYGFRPGRAAQHAIGESKRLIERSHMYYVVEFDIKGFFDNVDHKKLLEQIWALGIHDKWLIYIIRKMLKARIRLENGKGLKPEKGTPQGGILSPLLANIVLNELDRWVESQWEENPIVYKYKLGYNQEGVLTKSHGYLGMRRKTRLKEMYIVRYADDFRIFTNSQESAEKILIATVDWINTRLHLQVSPDKTKIVDLKKEYTRFLGFKFKAERKGQKYICKSHIDDAALKRCEKALKDQIIKVATPKDQREQFEELTKYNMMVMGIQNYYNVATCVNLDLNPINRRMTRIIRNRFGAQMSKTGEPPKGELGKRYGKSKMLRYIKGINEPIVPIGYVRYKQNSGYKQSHCFYTEEGRAEIHKKLTIDYSLLRKISLQRLHGRTIEYMDNRISLFTAQNGKCTVTGMEFTDAQDIHCHHIVPKSKGGTDKYQNLILVKEAVHILIHATQAETIGKYLGRLNLTEEQIAKVNALRKTAGIKEIQA